MKQDLINHVTFVVDESTSMRSHKSKVIEVFDATVASLADLSLKMNQETRVSVYLFSDRHRIRNVIADVDVLRLPSLRGFYEPEGWTALLDAVILAEEDSKLFFTKYGDHAILEYVITDGFENRSSYGAADRLRRIMASDGGKQTRAILVPDAEGKRQAIEYGFAPGNIQIWDVNSAEGMVDVGIAMAGATQTYMTDRAAGVTRSTTLFANQVTAEQVQAAVNAGKINEIDPSKYMAIAVTWPDDNTKWRFSGKKTKAFPDGVPSIEIRDFIVGMGLQFKVGTYFYLLVKSEKVHPGKDVIVRDRKTLKLYGGKEARQLIGLTDASTRIKPQPVKGDFDIFVRTDADNRLLSKHSTVLVPR